ncbi:MAG: hypothetical protein AB8G26_17165 [Ilumatobacter sp.]
MTASGGLTVTHTSTVTPDQIDHLGHMNVRYYAVNARAATKSIFGNVEVFDMYTRHHREQLVDTELEVRTGILGVDDSQTTIYHELADTATGALAATFVHRVRSTEPTDRVASIELPEHGRPRSIDIDAEMAAPTLGDVEQLGLAMRAPRTVDSDDTAGGERVPSSMTPFLFWGGEPADGAEFELLHTGPNGESMGWATMETRVAIGRLPTLGTRIQSFCATTAVADKTTQQAMWLFDLDTQELLATFESVSVLFDIGARRAISIPDVMRSEHEARLHPELGARRVH